MFKEVSILKILNAGNGKLFLWYDEKFIYDNEIAEALNMTTGLYMRLLKKFKAYEDTNNDNELFFNSEEEEDAKACAKFIEKKLENRSI